MKLLHLHGGQAGAGASRAEVSMAGETGAAVIWQPGMSTMDQDELQELEGGAEGRAAQGLNMGTQPHTVTKAEIPDHVLYTIGTCVLIIGSIGIIGNLLVLYAFYSNKKLRTPQNYFIMNLAVSDFLMSASQAPMCFVNSLHREWILGDIGSYVPEGLMISCTWDYVTYSPANRSYTMILCCCVFFIPLIIIFHCYLFMFLAIRRTGRDVQKLGSCSRKSYLSQSMKNEWKLAKIAFVVIVVFVLSWSPYACVTLIAWAGRGNTLTPYSKSVPAVIAKASAIYNPIIYAIIHPRYRKTIHNAVPCLRFLIRISKNDLLRGSINESSFRTSLSSHQSLAGRTKSTCVSSVSTGEATQPYSLRSCQLLGDKDPLPLCDCVSCIPAAFSVVTEQPTGGRQERNSHFSIRVGESGSCHPSLTERGDGFTVLQLFGEEKAVVHCWNVIGVKSTDNSDTTGYREIGGFNNPRKKGTKSVCRWKSMDMSSYSSRTQLWKSEPLGINCSFAHRRSPPRYPCWTATDSGVIPTNSPTNPVMSSPPLPRSAHRHRFFGFDP
ncbi:melanopsin-like [Grus japonensis]|uniref:Melanopsin-like n=1 Tax=Grus japonensis TaxID=30415 RepID=A0ABC9WWH2_GRUJA